MTQPGPQGQPPQYPGYGPHQPQVAPKKKRKIGRVIVLGVVLGLVIGVGGGLGLLTLMNSGSSEEAATEQQGPPKPETGLTSMTAGSGPARNYAGTAMYDACALLPMDELAKIGLEKSPEQKLLLTRIDRNIPPGPGIVRDEDLGYPASSCTFTPAGGTSGTFGSPSVTVNVTQPPFNAPDDDIDFFGEAEHRKVQGIEVVTEDYLDTGWESKILLKDAVVAVQMSDMPEQIKGQPKRKVFDQAVDLIVEQGLNGPKPPPEFQVKKYKDVPRPCDVFTHAAFEKSGAKDSGYVEEVVPTFEYLTHYPAAGYVGSFEMSCRRHDPTKVLETEGGVEKLVWIDVYDSVEGAKVAHDGTCLNKDDPMTAPVFPTDIKLGDGESCLYKINESLSLIFRVGNIGVRTSASVNGLDPVASQAELLPLAQQMEKDLRALR